MLKINELRLDVGCECWNSFGQCFFFLLLIRFLWKMVEITMEIRKLVKKVNKLKSKTKLIKTKVENEQNYLLKIKRKS